MNKLCIFAGTTVCSYGFWYLGAPFGFFVGFLASGVGSDVGVYLGWKLAQKIDS